MRTLAIVLALSSPAAAQVTLTFRYEDRPYTQTGFTMTTTFLPVRQAEVEIIRDSDGTVLGAGATDDAGVASFPAIGGGEVVRARIYARRAGNQINATVLNNPGLNAVYAVTTGAAATPWTQTVDITIAGGAAPAFNIFDCAVKSFQYQATLDADLPLLPALLTLYWEADTANGTFFRAINNAVFLLGLTSDPDEYDDDIIIHEIGHWVAFNFSQDDTLGGPHTIIQQLDPRTSWSEGWAHYWSSTVRRFFPGEYGLPQYHVDNFGSGFSAFELEGPSFPLQTIMATNELAVAAALWDVTDAANEGAFDALSGNELEIWRAVNDRIPGLAEITLEDFRTGLALEVSGPVMLAVTGSETGAGVFRARNIRYYPDGNEPNNGAGTPTVLAPGPVGFALQTIFAAGDEDWFRIDATAGTLVAETSNLGDGANTLLELYDSTGTVLLASNNDRSPSDVSSLVAIVVASPATFLALVTRVGTVIEHGYYDVRAQVVANAAPLLTSIGASDGVGTAPLRVTLSAGWSDIDGGSLEFQWDFDGDGVTDWSSLEGPGVTTTFAEPGTFDAQLRIIDSGDAVTIGTVTLTVFPPAAPNVVVSPSVLVGPAPLNVLFSTTISGMIPASYAWDLEGDGIVDRVSVTAAPVGFTYRAPGIQQPQVVVTDSQGRAYRVFSPAIGVGVGAGPPSISSFTATSGILPYASTFTVAHSAGLSQVEFDLDGDGRYDRAVPPSTPLNTTLVAEIQRWGAFVARVRVIGGNGLTAESTAGYTARIVGSRGWIVEPLAGDRLSGTSITLTAEAMPAGILKKVQFQYRSDLGGPWIAISGPFLSQGTLFSTAWNIGALADLAVFDLRVLVDDAFSSGDDADTVVMDRAAPTLREDGPARERGVRPDATTASRNGSGVWMIVPCAAVTAPSMLRLEPEAAPLANGSALGMSLQGQAWRVGGDATFLNTFRLRMPFSELSAALEIHRFDDQARIWHRLFPSRVSHADSWVESEVHATGLYAIFESGIVAGEPEDRCLGATGPAGPGSAGPAILLALFGAVRWRRR